MRLLFRIILSNFIIAVFVFFGVYKMYSPIEKYQWLSRTQKEEVVTYDFFIDIDNDKDEEYLVISENNHIFGSLTLYNDDNLLLNLTNLPYDIYVEGNDKILFEDANNNGIPEIYMLGVKNDSLYLLTIEYINGKITKPNVRVHFLDILKRIQGKYQFVSNFIFEDIDGTGNKSLIISITSGYSIFPRRIYAYYPYKDQLYKSPIAGAAIIGMNTANLDRDGKKEIVLQTQAYCNIYDQIFEELDLKDKHDSLLLAHKDDLLNFGDCSSWLIVLDHQLNFKFNPYSIQGWTSRLSTQVIQNEDEVRLVSVVSNYMDTLTPPSILVFDADGTLLEEDKLIGPGLKEATPPLSLIKPKDNDELFLIDNNSLTFRLSEDFSNITIEALPISFNKARHVTTIIDNSELYVLANNENINIYDQDKQLLKSIAVPGVQESLLYATIKSFSEKEDILMIDMGEFKVQMRLSENVYYSYRWLIWALAFFLVWGLVYITQKVFSFRAEKDRARLKKIIEERTKEVEQQKSDLKRLADDLRDKNDKVYQQNLELQKRRNQIESLYGKLTSSITYGKGIKDALLPSVEYHKTIFPESFVFFKPKNVVGGDFYWSVKLGNKRILVVGDASGEGISGGFLSLLAINVLNNFKLKEQTKASDVLKSVNNILYKHLSGYLKNEDDGIEMAVVFIEEKEDSHNVQFASANLPIYFFDSQAILGMNVLTANDYSVRADIDNQSFKDVELNANLDSMFYLSTKGFRNQLGGENATPFEQYQLKLVLQRVHVLSIEEQQTLIVEKFDKWQGAMEQTEDILCIGVKL
ncbi:MAG: SpoIIE family protein phosphatase [Bacteroidales bacterium]|nr:SpoIIE family protein phosphatase [Bacteroidales bacterium]